MTGKNGAHFHRIEWEGLQDTWGAEDLAASPMLPPGSERVELRRDDQYRIEAKILGTWDESSGDPLPDLGETGLSYNTVKKYLKRLETQVNRRVPSADEVGGA